MDAGNVLAWIVGAILGAGLLLIALGKASRLLRDGS